MKKLGALSAATAWFCQSFVTAYLTCNDALTFLASSSPSRFRGKDNVCWNEHKQECCQVCNVGFPISQAFRKCKPSQWVVTCAARHHNSSSRTVHQVDLFEDSFDFTKKIGCVHENMKQKSEPLEFRRCIVASTAIVPESWSLFESKGTFSTRRTRASFSNSLVTWIPG